MSSLSSVFIVQPLHWNELTYSSEKKINPQTIVHWLHTFFYVFSFVMSSKTIAFQSHFKQLLPVCLNENIRVIYGEIGSICHSLTSPCLSYAHTSWLYFAFFFQLWNSHFVLDRFVSFNKYTESTYQTPRPIIVSQIFQYHITIATVHLTSLPGSQVSIFLSMVFLTQYFQKWN